ncbi:phage lysis protein [Escherichia coli]|nr:phage lysis protein [Escherichia coli]EIW2799563.1 phage lysis protein [Escherichia coli]
MPLSQYHPATRRSPAIRQLENALARCASQVKMIKHCQDENDAQTRQPAQGAD